MSTENGHGDSDLLTRLSSLGLVLLGMAGALYLVGRGGTLARSPAVPSVLATQADDSPAKLALCGPPMPGQPPTVTLAYGPEVQPFIAEASARLASRCPNFALRHLVVDDLQAAQSITQHALAVTLWIPRSALAIRLAEPGLQRVGSPAGKAPEPILAQSPQVAVVWEDRAPQLQAALAAAAGQVGVWQQLGCSSGTPPLQFQYPSPVRSAAGLGSLFLLAFDLLVPQGKPPAKALGAAELSSEIGKQQEFLRRSLAQCRRANGTLPNSEAALVKELQELGSERADIASLDEYAALRLVDAQHKHGIRVRGLRIMYPRTALRNQYRVFTLSAATENHSPEQMVAQRWIAFMQSEEVQRLAIEHGFRPVGTPDAIRSYDVPSNPFLRLRRFGVELEPVQSEPPIIDAEAVRKLIAIWEDATGTN